MAYNRQNKSKYNKKSVHYATPKRGAKASKPQKQQYRKYYHEQPSKRFVYVEEPDSEGDESEDVVIEKDEVDGDFVSSEEDSEEDLDSNSDSSSEEEEEIYEFELRPQDIAEEDSSDVDTKFIDASDVESESDENEYYVGLDDRLVSAEDVGVPEIHDLNDEIVAYYDDEESNSSSSDSGSESTSDSDPASDSDSNEVSDSDEEVEAVVHLTEEANSSDEEDSENEVIGYIVDTDKLNEKLLLESIRQEFEEELVSPDEYESRDEDSDLGSEPEYIEVDSEEEDENDESSDEESVTIYKSLPCTECDCEDEDDDLQVIKDDDEEFSVVDLSDDVANSQDYQLEELDDGSYKLNVRFPSLVRDELKIEFLKNENELVIKGKLNFNGAEVEEEEEDDEEENDEEEDVDVTQLTPAEFINYALEDDDDEDDNEYDYADPEEVSEEEYSGDEDSLVASARDKARAESAKRDFILSQIEESERRDGYNEESDDDYEIDSEDEETADFEGFYEDSDEDSEDESESSEEESESSEDEELQEDAEDLINEFKNQEVFFEKHFQFDKVIKFNKIKAKFVGDDELELIIPSKGATVEQDNSFAITIDSSDDEDESSTTEEIDGNVPVLRDLDELLEAVEAA